LGGIDIGGGLTITFSCCLIHSKEDDDDNASLTGLSIRIATFSSLSFLYAFTNTGASFGPLSAVIFHAVRNCDEQMQGIPTFHDASLW